MDYTQVRVGVTIVVVIAVIFVVYVKLHARLVDAKNRIVQAYEKMDIYFRRRALMVEDLRKAAEEAGAETADLETLDQALDRAAGADGAKEKLSAESALGEVMERLAGVLPDEGAAAKLCADFEKNEGYIGRAAVIYNKKIEEYQHLRTTFPTSLLAHKFRFDEMPRYEEAGAERAAEAGA